jgi:hypothetical protein
MPGAHPLSYDEEARRAGVTARIALGVRSIRVKRIVGSAGKASKIGPDFLPANSRGGGGNYRSILRRMQAGEILPPIVVYELNNRYYVVDGHTRVAAAKALGVEFIDADVTEALASREGEVNLTQYARHEFERYTGLEGIRLTAPWRYHLLHDHIEGYRVYLERSRGREISLPDAAHTWRRSQYVPTMLEIRRRKLTSSRGGRTTGDIYTDILRDWAEDDDTRVSLREMLDRYDQRQEQGWLTRAKRRGITMVDTVLPKAVSPIGLPAPEKLAVLDVEAELSGPATDAPRAAPWPEGELSADRTRKADRTAGDE